MSDVGTAFLNSPPLSRDGGPLYATVPRDTGIPDEEGDVLVEVIRNVYGLNSAPRAWHETLRSALQELGWEPSALDPCLYLLRRGGKTCGAIIVYADDLAIAARELPSRARSPHFVVALTSGNGGLGVVPSLVRTCCRTPSSTSPCISAAS